MAEGLSVALFTSGKREAVDNRAKQNGTRILIMEAAGRDLHNFNMSFRDNPDYRVGGATAAQISHIDDRLYPPALAGALYPAIPIHAEQELDRLIRTRHVERVVCSYSDVSHEALMHQASRAMAAGADFSLAGPQSRMLPALRPVVSVCATRTGAGKSPVARRVVRF
jgi:predicted GTPase